MIAIPAILSGLLLTIVVDVEKVTQINSSTNIATTPTAVLDGSSRLTYDDEY